MKTRPEIEPGVVRGDFQVPLEDGRIQCVLCPRRCSLRPGQAGFCFVRQAREDQIVLTTYGRSTGFCVDPIEKKPLNHFLPGTSVLSFGTAGCNLGCRFCQNWDMSKARHVDQRAGVAYPEDIANMAQEAGCRSVAFTYNDPIIFAEYAVDTALVCRERGIRTVAVTAGYVLPAARKVFFEQMDAANVDLKAFSERFYRKWCAGHLAPVLETLQFIKEETNTWLEITNLIIPGENDGPDEIARMCDWVAETLGVDVPVHFSAFHPDFKMRDKRRTPLGTLQQAKAAAHRAGLRYVYVGNVSDPASQSTFCPQCSALLIERTGYRIGQWGLNGSACVGCGCPIAGRFDEAPGSGVDRRFFVR